MIILTYFDPGYRKTKHPETLERKDEIYQRFQAKVTTAARQYPKMLKCDKCELAFMSHELLEAHRRIHDLVCSDEKETKKLLKESLSSVKKGGHQ